MLIRSPESLNVYRPASFVNHVDENRILTEGEWRKDITGDTFYPLQTPRSGDNTKSSAKATKDEFKDYFIIESALIIIIIIIINEYFNRIILQSYHTYTHIYTVISVSSGVTMEILLIMFVLIGNYKPFIL